MVADLAAGLEPGDLTKYSALPWQSDFNECATQDVNITCEDWNLLYQSSTGDPALTVTQNTYWWPSHRPMQVFLSPSGPQTAWSPTPQTNAGDLQMVTMWTELGFIKEVPGAAGSPPAFVQVERHGTV